MLASAYVQPQYATKAGANHKTTFKDNFDEDNYVFEVRKVDVTPEGKTEKVTVVEYLGEIDYVAEAGPYSLPAIQVKATGTFAPPPEPSKEEMLTKMLLEFTEAQKEKVKANSYEVQLAAAHKRYIKLEKLQKLRGRVVFRMKNLAYLGFKQFALKGLVIWAGPAALAWIMSSGVLFQSAGALSPFWKSVLFSGLESFAGLMPAQSQAILKSLTDLSAVVPDSATGAELFKKAFGGKNPFLESIDFSTLRDARTLPGDKVDTSIAMYQENMLKVIQSLIGARLPFSDAVNSSVFVDMFGKEAPKESEILAAKEIAESAPFSPSFRYILSTMFPRSYNYLEKKLLVLSQAAKVKRPVEKEKTILEKLTAAAEKAPNWSPVNVNMLKTMVTIQNGINTAFQGKSLISAGFEAYNACEFEIDNVIGIFTDPAYEKSTYIGQNVGSSVDSFFNNAIMRETVKSAIGERVFNAAAMVFSKEKMTEILNSKNGIPLYFGTLTPGSFIGYMNNAFYNSVTGTISSGIKDIFVTQIWPNIPNAEERALKEKEEREREKAFQETMVKYSVKLAREGKRGEAFAAAFEEFRILNAPPEFITVEDLTTYQKIMREFNTQINAVDRSTEFKTMMMYGALLGGSSGINFFLKSVKGGVETPYDLLRVFTSGYMSMATDFSKGMLERKVNKALRQLQISLIDLYNQTYKALIRDHVQSYFKPMYEWKERNMAKLAQWMERRIGNSLIIRKLLSPALTMILNFFQEMPAGSLDTFFQTKLRESSLGMGLTSYEASMNPLTVDAVMARLNKMMNLNALDFAAISRFFPTATPGTMANLDQLFDVSNAKIAGIGELSDPNEGRSLLGLAGNLYKDPAKVALQALAGDSKKVPKIKLLQIMLPDGSSVQTTYPDTIKQYAQNNFIELALKNPDKDIKTLFDENNYKIYGFTFDDVKGKVDRTVTPDDFRKKANDALIKGLFAKLEGQSFKKDDKYYKISRFSKGQSCDVSIPQNFFLNKHGLCIEQPSSLSVGGITDALLDKAGIKNPKMITKFDEIFDGNVLNLNGFDSLVGSDLFVFNADGAMSDLTAENLGDVFAAINALRLLASENYNLGDLMKQVASNEDFRALLPDLASSIQLIKETGDELGKVLDDDAKNNAYKDFKDGKTSTLPGDIWYAHRANMLADDKGKSINQRLVNLLNNNPELKRLLENSLRQNLERQKDELVKTRDRLMEEQRELMKAYDEMRSLIPSDAPDDDAPKILSDYTKALEGFVKSNNYNKSIGEINNILHEMKTTNDVYLLMFNHYKINGALARGSSSLLPTNFNSNHARYVALAKNQLKGLKRRIKLNTAVTGRSIDAIKQKKSEQLDILSGFVSAQGGTINAQGEASGCKNEFEHVCSNYNSMASLGLNYDIPALPSAPSDDALEWFTLSAYRNAVNNYNRKIDDLSNKIKLDNERIDQLAKAGSMKPSDIAKYLENSGVGTELEAIAPLPDQFTLPEAAGPSAEAAGPSAEAAGPSVGEAISAHADANAAVTNAKTTGEYNDARKAANAADNAVVEAYKKEKADHEANVRKKKADLDKTYTNLTNLKKQIDDLESNIKTLDADIKRVNYRNAMTKANMRARLSFERAALVSQYNKILEKYNGDSKDLSAFLKHFVDSNINSFKEAFDRNKLNDYKTFLTSSLQTNDDEFKTELKKQIARIESLENAYNDIIIGAHEPFDPNILIDYMDLDRVLQPTLFKIGSNLEKNARQMAIMLHTLNSATPISNLSESERALVDFIQDDNIRGQLLLALADIQGQFDDFVSSFGNFIPFINDSLSSQELSSKLTMLNELLSGANAAIADRFNKILERVPQLSALLKDLDIFEQGTASQNMPFDSALEAVQTRISTGEDLYDLRSFLTFSRGILIKSGGDVNEFLEDFQNELSKGEKHSSTWSILKEAYKKDDQKYTNMVIAYLGDKGKHNALLSNPDSLTIPTLEYDAFTGTLEELGALNDGAGKHSGPYKRWASLHAVGTASGNHPLLDHPDIKARNEAIKTIPPGKTLRQHIVDNESATIAYNAFKERIDKGEPFTESDLVLATEFFKHFPVPSAEFAQDFLKFALLKNDGIRAEMLNMLNDALKGVRFDKGRYGAAMDTFIGSSPLGVLIGAKDFPTAWSKFKEHLPQNVDYTWLYNALESRNLSERLALLSPFLLYGAEGLPLIQTRLNAIDERLIPAANRQLRNFLTSFGKVLEGAAASAKDKREKLRGKVIENAAVYSLIATNLANKAKDNVDKQQFSNIRYELNMGQYDNVIDLFEKNQQLLLNFDMAKTNHELNKILYDRALIALEGVISEEDKKLLIAPYSFSESNHQSIITMLSKQEYKSIMDPLLLIHMKYATTAQKIHLLADDQKPIYGAELKRLDTEIYNNLRNLRSVEGTQNNVPILLLNEIDKVTKLSDIMITFNEAAGILQALEVNNDYLLQFEKARLGDLTNGNFVTAIITVYGLTNIIVDKGGLTDDEKTRLREILERSLVKNVDSELKDWELLVQDRTGELNLLRRRIDESIRENNTTLEKYAKLIAKEKDATKLAEKTLNKNKLQTIINNLEALSQKISTQEGLTYKQALAELNKIQESQKNIEKLLEDEPDKKDEAPNAQRALFDGLNDKAIKYFDNNFKKILLEDHIVPEPPKLTPLLEKFKEKLGLGEQTVQELTNNLQSAQGETESGYMEKIYNTLAKASGQVIGELQQIFDPDVKEYWKAKQDYEYKKAAKDRDKNLTARRLRDLSELHPGKDPSNALECTKKEFADYMAKKYREEKCPNGPPCPQISPEVFGEYIAERVFGDNKKLSIYYNKGYHGESLEDRVQILVNGGNTLSGDELKTRVGVPEHISIWMQAQGNVLLQYAKANALKLGAFGSSVYGLLKGAYSTTNFIKWAGPLSLAGTNILSFAFANPLFVATLPIGIVTGGAIITLGGVAAAMTNAMLLVAGPIAIAGGLGLAGVKIVDLYNNWGQKSGMDIAKDFALIAGGLAVSGILAYIMGPSVFVKIASGVSWRLAISAGSLALSAWGTIRGGLKTLDILNLFKISAKKMEGQTQELYNKLYDKFVGKIPLNLGKKSFKQELEEIGGEEDQYAFVSASIGERQLAQGGGGDDEWHEGLNLDNSEIYLMEFIYFMKLITNITMSGIDKRNIKNVTMSPGELDYYIQLFMIHISNYENLDFDFDEAVAEQQIQKIVSIVIQAKGVVDDYASNVRGIEYEEAAESRAKAEEARKAKEASNAIAAAAAAEAEGEQMREAENIERQEKAKEKIAAAAKKAEEAEKLPVLTPQQKGIIAVTATYKAEESAADAKKAKDAAFEAEGIGNIITARKEIEKAKSEYLKVIEQEKKLAESNDPALADRVKEAVRIAKKAATNVDIVIRRLDKRAKKGKQVTATAEAPKAVAAAPPPKPPVNYKTALTLGKKGSSKGRKTRKIEKRGLMY